MGFGRNMRRIRRAKDITQQQLAEMLGCSFQLVSAYERETKNPSIYNAARIAQALHCTLDELVNGGK